MTFLEKIFSIKNGSLLYKHICIFGITIKIRRKVKPKYAYNNLPIDNNKIVFRSFNGAYTCNPKYIAEEILRQQLPYKLIWVVNKNILTFIDSFPRNIKLVMQGTAEEIRETSTSKIIIDNERRVFYIRKGAFKKNDQIYIQTFHGSFGIKKTGVDRKDGDKDALKIAEIDSSQVDYLISNGTYTTNFFKNMFWGYGKILEYGHPRNDVFFRDDSSIKEKVYRYFKIPKNKKILLYAPSIRKDPSLKSYSINLQAAVKAATQKFGGKWVVIIRLHPLLLDKPVDALGTFLQKNPNIEIIEGTKYADMQELLVAVDLLITDYSSCIYDYMLSYKPGFIFATDIKEYDNNRGLYYPLSTTPFPIAENNNELIKNIQNFNIEKYEAAVTEFLKGKGSVEDGHASERVVELIKKILLNAEKNENTKKE